MGRPGAWIALVVFVAGTARASPVIETQDRLEINWTTLKVRFFGQAKATADGDEALKAAEKKAWQDGIAYVQSAVRDLNLSANEKERRESTFDQQGVDAKEAAKQVAKSTSSYSTTYYGDGTVRVILENQLPRALALSGVRFRQKEPATYAALEHSGIVLKLDKATKPAATYRIVDENGQVVFDVHDMAEEAYRRSLMGRWLKRPGPAEVADAAGKNPVSVDASVVSPGVMRVQRSTWDQAVDGHHSLLVNGTVALVMP